MGRPGTSKGAHKQRIRDKIRLRGRKLVSNAVERVRDSSVAVTRVLRPQTDTVVEWAVSKQLTGHTDGVWDIRVCPWETTSEDSIIGSASADRTARIWQAETGRELVCLVGHKGSVNSLCFHPYERLVSTASGDKSCGIWRLPPIVPADADRDAGSEAWQAADAGGGNLCLTRLRRKAMRPVLSLWGHSNAVSSAAWMASCGLIATASWDRSALLFDVACGASKPLRTLGGHDGPLTCIAAARCRLVRCPACACGGVGAGVACCRGAAMAAYLLLPCLSFLSTLLQCGVAPLLHACAQHMFAAAVRRARLHGEAVGCAVQDAAAARLAGACPAFRSLLPLPRCVRVCAAPSVLADVGRSGTTVPLRARRRGTPTPSPRCSSRTTTPSPSPPATIALSRYSCLVWRQRCGGHAGVPGAGGARGDAYIHTTHTHTHTHTHTPVGYWCTT